MATKNNNVKVAEAGIVGAVIGAAVGAGAVALSNPKNRKFLNNKFNELKKQGQKVYSDLQDKVEDLTDEGKEKVTAKVKELRSSAGAIKNSIKAKL